MAYEITGFVLADAPSLVTSGLIWHVDAGNSSSYPGSGTTWTDLSSSAVNGTLTGGVGYTSADGGALTFDAFNDLVDAPLNISGTSGTISLWVRPTSIGVRRNAFVNYSGSPYASWSNNLGISTTGLTEAAIFDGGTKGVGGTTTMSAGSWYYITQIWVNSSAMTVYMNAGASSEGSVAIGASWTGGTNIRVGCGSGGGWDMWDGRVGAVHIYNRNLSASEREQNFNATKTRFGY